MRARQNNFDPYLQVRSRLQQLQAMGHSVNKVELIIMGGTFLAATEVYQRTFVKRCLDAMIESDSPSLGRALQRAETSSSRPVGITIETRPDYCLSGHVDTMLAYGTTRVELGVQTIYDDIYEYIQRGHTISSVITATQVARDAGLKVCYHIMPGLNNFTRVSESSVHSFERDFQMFKALFERPEFKPDMLKIYPCLVLHGSPLFEMWRKGEYIPYTTQDVVDLLAKAIPQMPRWVRIQRMQRDIPKSLIVAGPNAGNLRELVFQQIEGNGYPIHTIRYREIGYKQRAGTLRIPDTPEVDALKLYVDEYSASGGTELFISLEEQSTASLIGFLRLRIPSDAAHRPEIREKNAALLRELHVFGLVADLGEKSEDAWQHHGVGERLLAAAEDYTRKWGRCRIVCTSGVGVRQYYSRYGYRRDGPYMTKCV